MMSTLSFSGSDNRTKQSPLAKPASEEINAERRLNTMAGLWTKVVKNTSVRYGSPFEHTWPPYNVSPMHVKWHVSFLTILRSQSRHLKVSKGLIPSLDTIARYHVFQRWIYDPTDFQPSTLTPCSTVLPVKTSFFYPHGNGEAIHECPGPRAKHQIRLKGNRRMEAEAPTLHFQLING